MLSGAALPSEFTEFAATMPDLSTDACVLRDAVVFQAAFEMAVEGRQDSLPVGLHPTNPPTMIVQAWKCVTSPWGAFTLAQGRVGCRSGLRPRGMVQACVVDNADAAVALRERWGLPARVGAVQLGARYHDAELTVALDDAEVCTIRGINPIGLGPDDVSYTTAVAMAETPRGLRLVQIDADFTTDHADRLRPVLGAFDGPSFGMHPAVMPLHPVAASVAWGDLKIGELRFLNRPDEMAFTGTETV